MAWISVTPLGFCSGDITENYCVMSRAGSLNAGAIAYPLSELC